MTEYVHLFLNDRRIGIVDHAFMFDDEKNTGRRIIEGCQIKLNDYSFRVIKVSEHSENEMPGYIAQLKVENI
jgi:hypothetical protein